MGTCQFALQLLTFVTLPVARAEVDALVLKILLAKLESIPMGTLHAFRFALSDGQSWLSTFKSSMWEADYI